MHTVLRHMQAHYYIEEYKTLHMCIHAACECLYDLPQSRNIYITDLLSVGECSEPQLLLPLNLRLASPELLCTVFV